MRGAPRQVDVIHADSGAGNHLHLRPGKGFLVALGARTDDDGIGVYHGSVVNGPAVQVNYLCVRLQYAFEKGYVGVCYNFHRQGFSMSHKDNKKYDILYLLM